ncbi:MAG: RNA polymerase subunit sigma-70 [Acidobacteria bacterium]|nr:MAG: RNA polymerase subunit sigma-70 [Acidobacteriota bacterium]REJ99213.1 MAG: RNA polymerase subunit sigma-70 [Acidobacteriota bacterium]REK16066.1 MAG: RNA polymerase subunit sigma-70 [Acidobacteriota bacterium]REK43747.1 MAG: RNA polymerase subunit sigma-70 [Acidobacteriota bacterium]
MEEPQDVTRLLIKWSKGDKLVLEELFPLVYGELQKIARRYLRGENRAITLQTTALVHEAYLKLIDQNRVEWQNRAHFFGIAAQAMRRILLDNARRRLAGKRGQGAPHISIDSGNIDVSDEKAAELVDLNDALERLEALDPQKASIVELRYFGGLSIEEAAEVLGVSVASVNRGWRAARAWLYSEIAKEGAGV